VNARTFRDPVFKGATRPAVVFGVPILAFVLVAGTHLLLGMWLLMLVGPFWLFVVLCAGAIELLALRLLSRYDPHRVNQTLLWASAWRWRRNRSTWGAHAMAPLDLKPRPR
jgi:type IV secretion system protein VirB3